MPWWLFGKLKRNIVLWPVQIRIGRGAWGGSRGPRGLATLGRSSFASSFTRFSTTGGSAFSGTEELDILPDYFEFAALLASGFVIPRIKLESPFNK